MKTSFCFAVTVIFGMTLAPPIARGQVFPVAHCIEIKPGPPVPGGLYPIFIAHFGYTNVGATPVTIIRGIAGRNYFDAGQVISVTTQPRDFLPGHHPFTAATVANVLATSQITAVSWILSKNFASLSMPAEGTLGTPLAVTTPFCSLKVIPAAQFLSTTGTALAQPIAGVRGDFGNPTAVVTPIGVMGGSGGISISNLVYTPSTYSASQPSYIPGKITADIAVSGWATPAQFVFQIKADGIPAELVSVPISYNPTGGNCASNVTAQTIATLGGFSQNIVTRVWSQTVRVQNSGASPIAGPVLLALDNLSANATLTGGNGVTNCAIPAGAPYVSLGSGLAPGQTAAVTLTFTNPQMGQAITYTPRILSGGTQQ